MTAATCQLLRCFELETSNAKTSRNFRPMTTNRRVRKPPQAYLVRYAASGKYFARIRVGRKLIRKGMSIFVHLRPLRQEDTARLVSAVELKTKDGQRWSATWICASDASGRARSRAATRFARHAR